MHTDVARLRLSVLTCLVFLSALSACAESDLPSAPVSRPGVSSASRASAAAAAAPTAVLRARLERPANGLLYTSESDYPFTWFFAAGPANAPLDSATMRSVLRADASVPIDTVSLEQFFARHIERVDPGDAAAVALVPRYRRLRQTLRSTLPNIRVFRVGLIEVHCYLVGTDSAGNVVGLSTIAIET